MCDLANILIDCWLLYPFYIYAYLWLFIVVFYIVWVYNLIMEKQTNNRIDCRLASNMGLIQSTKLSEMANTNCLESLKKDSKYSIMDTCLVHGSNLFLGHWFEEPKKSKNQVRRERHIFKRLQAKNLRAIAHNSKLVSQIIDGENVAPNHMKTNSVATIKQNERSRFRVVNYDRQISKGKGCTCDGMNFMCKSHRRKFKMT